MKLLFRSWILDQRRSRGVNRYQYTAVSWPRGWGLSIGAFDSTRSWTMRTKSFQQGLTVTPTMGIAPR